MEPIRHELRLGEVISPFGVGAVVDVLGESLVAPDTSWWPPEGVRLISCDRLTDRLGAGRLIGPPTRSAGVRDHRKGASLDMWRFPEWRSCERCGRLSRKTRHVRGRYENRCGCGGGLVPVRLVAVCTDGSHLQDIQWFGWTHRGGAEDVPETVRSCQQYEALRLERRRDRGEGFASLEVHCEGCGRKRSLAAFFDGSDTLKRDGFVCQGRQPWQPRDEQVDCPHPLVVTQRAATGNYLADRVSALDIPEELPARVRLERAVRRHELFPRVRDALGPKARIYADDLAEELGDEAVDADLVLELAAAAPVDQSREATTADLKSGEWAAFERKLQQGRDEGVGDFVVDGYRTQNASGWPNTLSAVVTHVGQVRRVREVRALRRFQRRHGKAEWISADLGSADRRARSFPAVEFFGEGVLLRLDEDRVAEWEQHEAVVDRIRLLGQRLAASTWAERLERPTPRLVMLHTLSHLLVRRLAFGSGYSSASLQERVYADTEAPDPSAGVFLFAAAGDAQGTLGGLVRMGRSELLVPLLVEALADAEWCSNDPVCRETDGRGAARLNLAACHGCTLASETSCEFANLLLDRQLVIGGDEVPGLFEGVLAAFRS